MGPAPWWTTYAPFITVLGPITGALIGASVTYLLVTKRQTVLFILTKSEDLTRTLHHDLQKVSHKIDDKEVLNLNRGIVIVTSKGNTSVKDLKFDIVLQGIHDFVLPKVSSSSNQLVNDVKVEHRSVRSDKPQNVITVSVPFLNPNEDFTISVFFDNVTVDCDVDFRMPDVRGLFIRTRDSSSVTPQVMETINSAYPIIALLIGRRR